MSQQTIIAYFDSRAEAQTAKAALTSAGIAAEAIRLLPEEDDTSYSRGGAETSYDYQKDEGGFWKSLGGFFLPDEDRYSYAEGLSRGGAALSVVTDEAHYDHVAQLLEENGADDIDERETEWRSTGWSGYTATESTTQSTGMTSETGAAASFATGGASVSGNDETIQVVEESLRVGKRQVDKGRVRIRSYVVETPVQEEISLRAEHVFLDRRPVDRAATSADLNFGERTIEAQERVEEAVISKEARVVEEIGLRSEAEEHVETVSDTVRKTEVEVVDERDEQASTRGLSGTTDRGPISR